MKEGMRPGDRLPYSAIIDRKPLKLPGGARLVLWPVLALEVWDIARPMARMVIPPPQGVPMLPDHPNWSWHEYGMRVGVWRIKRVLDDLGVRPTGDAERPHLHRVSARLGSLPGSGLGVQRPLLRADTDAQVRRRKRNHRGVHAHHHGFLRQEAARLVRSGADPDLPDAGSSRRGRRRIHRRLGARRPAGAREDDGRQVGRGAALQLRAPRHREHGRSSTTSPGSSATGRSTTSRPSTPRATNPPR